MHALTLARQRIRAHLQQPSTPRTVRLAHGLVETGKTRFVPVLASPLAQEILSHGYTAHTLDRVYADQADRGAGVAAALADRVVLDLPIHRAFRERCSATAGEIVAAAVLACREGEPEIRVLCAPCGLANEMLQVAERLRDRCPDVLRRIRFWGVDADMEGTVLPEAARRARGAGVSARFIREDLRRRREVQAVAREQGPFHVVSCVGLLQACPADDLPAAIRFYAGLLAPGGTLLVDRWRPAEPCRMADGLGARMECLPGRLFDSALKEAGLVLEREHATGEGGCVVMVARKPVAAPSNPVSASGGRVPAAC